MISTQEDTRVIVNSAVNYASQSLETKNKTPSSNIANSIFKFNVHAQFFIS